MERERLRRAIGEREFPTSRLSAEVRARVLVTTNGVERALFAVRESSHSKYAMQTVRRDRRATTSQ